MVLARGGEIVVIKFKGKEKYEWQSAYRISIHGNHARRKFLNPGME